MTRTVTVNDVTNPVISNVTTATPVNGSLQQTGNYTFSVNVTDNVALDSVTLQLGTANYTNISNAGSTYTAIIPALGPGTYDYQWFANDTSGNTASSNVSQYTVTADTTAPSFGNTSPSIANGSLPSTSNYSFSIDVTDNSSVDTVTFEFSGTNYTNLSKNGNTYTATITPPGVGNHGLRWYANDTWGNQGSSTPETYAVVADTDAPSIGAISSTPSNGTTYGSSTYEFSATITDNVAVDEAIFELDGVNSTNVTNTGSTYTASFGPLAAGTHTLRFHANDTNGNSASSNVTNYVIAQASPGISIIASPGLAVTYGTQTTINCSVTPSTLSTALTRNGGGVSNPDTNTLDVGTYNYTCSTLGNTNYTAANTTVQLVLSTADPIMHTLLNGTDADIQIDVNESISIAGNISNPSSGSIQLYVDSNQIGTGTGYVPSMFNSSTSGTFTVTTVFAGDSNYNARNVSRIIFVGDAIIKSNITPASGSSVNSPFNLSFTTSNSTTCRYSTSDDDYASMSNAFTAVNGTSHQAEILLTSLGMQNLHVSCTNETSATNLDLAYDVENVIINSTVTNSTINDTILNTTIVRNDSALVNTRSLGSTIDFTGLTNANITTSTVTGSLLTNCVVINSTVKNIAATGCYFENSLVDPPTPSVDLSGSNITGNSNIWTSNVTYSDVDHSNITDSNINNSVIKDAVLTNVMMDNSTLMNTSLDQATVINANITNGVIYSGTINATIYYDASTNGSANLSDIINLPPTASFTTSSTSVTTGTSVTFTSTSSDPNIGGPLNDSLTYLWRFGDGSTSSSQNPSHSYSSTGSYTVNLTVTDSFNSTSTSSNTVITVTSAGGGGGGGGGSGGSSGRTYRTTLTTTEQSFNVRYRDDISFSFDGEEHVISIGQVSNGRRTVTVASDPVTVSMSADTSRTFDLNDDDILDLKITMNTVPLSSYSYSNVSIQRIREDTRPPQLNVTQTTNTTVNDSSINTTGTILDSTVSTGNETGNVTGQQDVPPSRLTAVWNTIKAFFEDSRVIGALIVIAILIVGLALYFVITRLFE
ncbi:PKD domain-containing protein [Candidatus Woesearchaeota archaeon]|nr:PKD domain-containing protein [Candidatus Woesearchaeota archaeon]